jgi:hypothetical protein
MRLDIALQVIHRPGRVEIPVIAEPDAGTRLTGQIEILRFVLEEHPHVGI